MRRCHSNCKLLQNDDSLLKLIHAKDHLQELIDRQVANHEQSIASTALTNPKQYWSYVNSKLKNKKNNLKMIKKDGRIIIDSLEIAEAFNDHFYRNYNHKPGDIDSFVCYTNLSSSWKRFTLAEVNINCDKVNRLLKMLPDKRSEDYDGFSYTILKRASEVLSKQLFRLFTRSLYEECLPRDWKRSLIFPIIKKPGSSDIENFRPINVTSCMCRLLERIIRDSIQDFLDVNGLINSSQHGFSRGKSTETALLKYTNDLTLALDCGKCIDAVYLDFSKAFDSVRHDYLLQKLQDIGISGSLFRWIRDYFISRSQIITVNVVCRRKILFLVV